MIPSNRQLAPARSLPARVIAASAALAAFVGLVFVVLLVAIDEQRQIDARSRNSQQVVAAATQVEKLSVDLETGLRGFQLTGSQQFLAPWRVARAELPDQLARLDRLTDAPGIDPVSRSAAATIVAQLDSYVHGYAEPLVARLDRGPMSHAADVATTDEGKRRFDALRRSLDRLVAAQGARAGARSASVRSHASRLITLGVTGLVVCLLLILLFAIYVHRVLVRPVRSVARAVRQLEDGDSSARVPAMRSPELDDLSRAFNSMAESLTSNRYDLEQAIDQLADGKARIERFEEFGRRMASQSDIEPLAEDVLDQLTEMLDAPVAALYGIRAPQDEVAHLLASRGVPRTALPTTVGVDDGTPGRAIDEGRTIEVEDGSGLASRHEIHVPLFLGDRVIGVLTLARTEDRAFDPIEVLSAEYLSRQVAVGIANAVSLRDARRQAAINHAVLETATDAFVSIDSAGNVSAWNRSAELSFGWSRLEAIGRPLSDTIASTSFCDGLQDFVRTGRSPMMNRTIELTALHCDGREIPVELTISPLMLDGEWTFNAFIRDVSERKRAEQYARAQHAVTRALADSSGLDESRLAAPRALATALGFESGATWIDAGGDEHGVEPRWVEDGDRRGIHLPVVSDERGVLGVIELWTSEARDADQDLLEMLATVASQLAEHTERMRAEAEADRLKDDFFALVSHELRTPLTSIIGYLDLVLEEPERLDPDTARFLEVVARNGRRLHRLVGDLLFVAQVEAGTLAIEKGSVDLTSAVAESVEAARPRAEERGILLRVDAQRVPACSGDADRIGQTLDNLISNAIKFTPEEGSVDVMLRRDGGDAVIEVRDTGIGIPPDDMDRLFERFFRSSLATEQAIQGVGLGLTIAKAIVETHGGRISVESESGRGTTFTVRLPVGAQPGAEIAMDPARVANPGISR